MYFLTYCNKKHIPHNYCAFKHGISNNEHTLHTLQVQILTYANGDVSRPLVVVLTSDHPLSNQLKAKLALEPQHVPVQKPTALLEAIQRCAWIPTTLLINLCQRKRQG